MSKTTNRVSLIFISFATLALFIGTLFGPLQALEHAQPAAPGLLLNFYPFIKNVLSSYYQGLSLHGVLNALVWTFAFTAGFLLYATSLALNVMILTGWVLWLALALMILGVVITAIPMLLNLASVLYTFYPPSSTSHVLSRVGTGNHQHLGCGICHCPDHLRLEERSPRRTHASYCLCLGSDLLMWIIASAGITVEVLVFILPWSLGWVEFIHPQLSRVSGSRVIPWSDFWLLPAYVAWYMLFRNWWVASSSPTPWHAWSSSFSSCFPTRSDSITNSPTPASPRVGRPCMLSSPFHCLSPPCSPCSP